LSLISNNRYNNEKYINRQTVLQERKNVGKGNF
jgi:hypothetical protein